MGLQIDPEIRGAGEVWTPELVGDRFAKIGACGASFARGVFKFHDSVSGPLAHSLVSEAFPALAEASVPFAFDWLGRQYFAVAGSAVESEVTEVAFVDPAEMSVELLLPLEQFLALLSAPDMLELVETELFAEWLGTSGVDAVGFDECAGVAHPLFLGGERVVGNLELSNTDVYWSVMTQVWRKSESLADGEQLGGV